MIDCFVHLPYVKLDEGVSIPVLGGHLAPFSFEDFRRVDGDWARESYFKATNPAIWKCSISGASAAHISDTDLVHNHIQPTVMLLYYALLSSTIHQYPDPRLSMTYLRYPNKRVMRTIGRYERTLLLNRPDAPITDQQAAKNICALADKWYSANIAGNDPIFDPYVALSMNYMVPFDELTTILPIIVSLEGFLIPQQVASISRTFRARVSKLLNDSSEVLANNVKKIYAWRSDIMHGKIPDRQQYETLYPFLVALTQRIVCASANWYLAQDEPNRNIQSLQTYLAE